MLQAPAWSGDAEALRRWKEGTTGWPLVDANMRELKATGALGAGGCCWCGWGHMQPRGRRPAAVAPAVPSALSVHARSCCFPPPAAPLGHTHSLALLSCPPRTTVAVAGFMSNRGRQNVASFLALDLGVDWRLGGDWFESLLLDYDPSRCGGGGGGGCGPWAVRLWAVIGL